MKLNFSHTNHSTKHRLALPKHSFFHKIGRDFVIDWMVMIFIGVLLVFVFGGIGYIKFHSSEDIINSDTVISIPEKIVSFDDKRLDILLEKYDEKQKVRASLNSGQFFIPDPGL